MYGWLEKLLLPDDEKPESVRRHRLRSSLGTCGAIACLVFVVLPALFGVPYVIPKIGQAAWANDVDKAVDDKIKAAIAPVIDTQKEQGEQLTAALDYLRESKIVDLQKTILLTKKEQCDAIREGRSATYWTQQLSQQKQRYFELTANQADVPSCAEV